MRIKARRRKLFYIIIGGFSILLLFFLLCGVWIGYEAEKLCQEANLKYNSANCVEALITQLEDENQSFSDRNHAVWALGQMGDSRALSVLQKYYTGIIPSREPINKAISQYELKKAINLAAGGINITAWTWRWRFK